LFPKDDDFTVLFWSGSSDRPCMYLSRIRIVINTMKTTYLLYVTTRNYYRFEPQEMNNNDENVSKSFMLRFVIAP
jgi:hypothetical protein